MVLTHVGTGKFGIGGKILPSRVYTSLVCVICKNPETLATVNALLKQRVPILKIAEATGVSKSVVGRHKLLCNIYEQARKLKKKNTFNPNARVVIAWSWAGKFQHLA